MITQKVGRILSDWNFPSRTLLVVALPLAPSVSHLLGYLLALRAKFSDVGSHAANSARNPQQWASPFGSVARVAIFLQEKRHNVTPGTVSAKEKD